MALTFPNRPGQKELSTIAMSAVKQLQNMHILKLRIKRNHQRTHDSSVIVDIVIDFLVEIIITHFRYHCPNIRCIISYYIMYTKTKFM